MPPKGYKFAYKRVFTNWCSKCKTTFQAYSPNKAHDHKSTVISDVEAKAAAYDIMREHTLSSAPSSTQKPFSPLADLIEKQIDPVSSYADFVECFPVEAAPQRIPINTALDELYRRVRALEERIGE